MTHYAKLLFIHIRQIELLEAEFDNVASALLTLSHKEGNIEFFKLFLLLERFEDDGTSYTMLQLCWPSDSRVL